MEMVKKVLLGLIVFSLAFFVGAFYRATWFFTFQKGQFERRYLYRDLAESKLGGQTPQETWNLYLDALAKGDIETAVQYWVPEKRVSQMKLFQDLVERSLFMEYSRALGHKLLLTKSNEIIDKNHQIFQYSFEKTRNIDLVFAGRTQIPEVTIESTRIFWKQLGKPSIKSTSSAKFILNHYTNRWLIEE